MNPETQSTGTPLLSALRLLQNPASGVAEPALKKKPIAALLTRIYGQPNAETAEKPVISTPVK